ncbi:MAG: RNA polymerase sigma factor [Bacteroidales bacterium]|nr:RNA polymerase sigma factor [Bacteroidales bacterium]
MPFTKIYNLYYIRIYQFVYRHSFSHPDSEDITQEVFMNLHTEINKKNTPNNIKAWLYKCALNKFININKRKKVIHLTDNINQYEKALTNSIEYEVIQNEKKRLISKALSMLSQKEQILLNLYNDDFSYKEISKILEIKFTSVGKTLSRVIDKLAIQIKKSNHEELCRERSII